MLSTRDTLGEETGDLVNGLENKLWPVIERDRLVRDWVTIPLPDALLFLALTGVVSSPAPAAPPAPKVGPGVVPVAEAGGGALNGGVGSPESRVALAFWRHLVRNKIGVYT